MKDESEVRSRYNRDRKHYEESDRGNKDFQHGYVFALEWVLGLHEEDGE